MPRPLPDINQLVADVLARVDSEGEALRAKEAAAPPPVLTVPIAQGLQKLAHQLRQAAHVPVTIEDVHDFADRWMEHTQ